MSRASARVDLSAIRRNLGRIGELAGSADVMAVVKADAYGHGLVPVARAARAAGTSWLGVALPSEALALRSAGDDGRVLAWLWSPGDESIDACVAGSVDLSISSSWALAEVVAAVARVGRPARVHVKVDSGLSRNGVGPAEWPHLIDALVRAQTDGSIEVEAIWSHLADADLPGAATVPAQHERFLRAIDSAGAAGISPRLRHLSNSGGLWAYPGLRFDLVRTGIAMYGLTPAPNLGTAAELGLEPAMTLRASLASVKSVDAGTSVSYGSTWTTSVPTTLGLVPLGYADGVPRASGGRVEVAVNGRRYPAVGRTAMDQFVIDLGTADVQPGDEAILFGPGRHGELTADEWAGRIDTIGYELVTRLGSRVPREYVGEVVA
ncbi:MAG: alanine racemase [bacterium]|nr:alanine racemase [bacterium]